MSSGPRSAPSELPGFTADRWLGGGGFADVFLYTQHRPSRSVAIKILRREHLSADALAQFDAEADIMAEVSTHPYIVAIFSSGVSPDGRPFIVMEHYPKPHFGERARGGRMDITEVLRTGIQVSSAVETAHRAGIIHRDIKPANILTSAFDRPGLTDFGISGVQTEAGITAAAGMTIAYSAPELLEERSPGSVATDVYGLAATVAALAAGHSAFWSPDGDNTDQAVLQRALMGQITPITRSDAPASLNHLVAQAMHPDARKRPASALAFAQALQEIEQQLRLQPTPIDVVGLGGHARRVDDNGDDDERTRRPIQVVDPEGVTPSPPKSRPPAKPTRRPGPPPVPIIAASSAPPAAPLAPPGSAAPPGSIAPVSRVPAVSTTPSWAATSTPPATSLDETVARPRTGTAGSPPARAAFTPPTAPDRPDLAPGPLGVGVPGTESPVTPPPEVVAHKARKSFPWKPVAAAGALIVALAVVAVVFSSGGRDAKDAPTGRAVAQHAPPQSITPGTEPSVDPGAPAVTPTDTTLEPFQESEAGLVSIMSWTAPDDPAARVAVKVSASDGSTATPPHTIELDGRATASGRIAVQVAINANGQCFGLRVADAVVPAELCQDGPPCFSVTAVKPDAATGEPVRVHVSEEGFGPIAVSPATFEPDNYNRACAGAG